jgi:hypothetical protein
MARGATGPPEENAMDTTQTKAQKPGARAEERERRTRDKIQEEVAREFTAEVRTVNALDLEGDAVSGEVFEIWTADGRCVVVAEPNPVTSKVIVCVDRAGTYVVKYLVNGRVVEQRNLETEPIALAVELD